jgi:hypothetical protein
MLHVPSEGVPYFLFFLTGMSCWRIFERGVLRVTRSRAEPRPDQEGLFPATDRADLLDRAGAHRVRRASSRCWWRRASIIS